MTGILWLASCLLFPLAGWPLLSHRAYRALPPATCLVLAGACGALLTSFAMTLAVLLGLRWHPATLIVAAAAFAFLLRGLVRDETAPRAAAAPDPAGSDPGGPLLGAAWLLSFAAVAAALLAVLAGAASSPDLLFFWGPKAQQFAIARTFDAGFMRDEFHQYMHSYYPPLVTNLGAFASIVAGRLPWTAATLTFPLLLAALAAGLPGVLAEGPGRRRAAAVSALAVAAIGWVGVEADVAGNGEMPLLFFETLATALLLSPLARRGAVQLLAGLLLSGAAATKVEGLPFVLALVLFFLIARPDASRPAGPVLLRLGAPTVVALAAWFAFGATRKLFYGYSEYGRFLDLHPDHIGVVLVAIGRSLWAAGRGLSWAIPLLCLLAALPLSRSALLPLGTAAALTGFLLFTYIHRAEDPSLWISWSAARVFSPVAMLLALTATCGPASQRPMPGTAAPTRD